MIRYFNKPVGAIRKWLVLAAVLVFTFPAVEAGTLVRVQTLAGTFVLELFDDIAPQTTENFLNYVASQRYNLTVIHRSEPGVLIQGGNWQFNESQQNFSEIPKDGTVPNEFNVSNERGTIAMAKPDNSPNGAVNEWFINLQFNSTFDTTNGGYTVFGEVITGMDVVDFISGLDRVVHPQIDFGIPIFSFNGGSVSNNDLVNVTMAVLANSYDPDSGLITISVDAQSLGLLRVSFSVVSVEQGIIQGLPETVEVLTEPRGAMSTFDTATGRLTIPEIAVDGDIAFRNAVFVLTDDEQLLFQLESVDAL